MVAKIVIEELENERDDCREWNVTGYDGNKQVYKTFEPVVWHDAITLGVQEAMDAIAGL